MQSRRTAGAETVRKKIKLTNVKILQKNKTATLRRE